VSGDVSKINNKNSGNGQGNNEPGKIKRVLRSNESTSGKQQQ